MRPVDPPLHQPAGVRTFLPLVMIGCWLTVPISAQAADGFSPMVAYAISYDDNLLGLPRDPAGEAASGPSAMSDTVHTRRIGLQFEKTIGRQRLSADLKGGEVRYDRYTLLDHQARDLKAAWNWQIGNLLNGTASTKHVRSLMSFDDYHVLERRLQTERTDHVDFRWRFHPRWEFVGGGTNARVSYDTGLLQSRSRRELSGEIGLDYLTPSGNNIGAVIRRTDGRYPSLVDLVSLPFADDFEQHDLRLRGTWQATGKILAQFNGGYVSRQHNVFGARDFSGTNARLSLTMAMMGKSAFNVAAWRELGVVDDLVAYSVNKGLSAGYTWAVTSKLQSDLTLHYESRDLPPSEALGPGSAYGDTTRRVMWSVDYVPRQRWLLRTSLFRKLKDGQAPLTSFSRNGASVTLQYQIPL